MASFPRGATVVVRMADAGRDQLVLARIIARCGEREMEVTGPLLATAQELAVRVGDVVARLSREITGGPANGPPSVTHR